MGKEQWQWRESHEDLIFLSSESDEQHTNQELHQELHK